MKRRDFLQKAAFLTGAFVLADHLPSTFFKRKIKGRVVSGGKGLKGVVVSDGYTVIATDQKGRYEFEPNPAATTVFISTPAGYGFLQEKNIARHYRRFADGESHLDFELERLPRSDHEHQFIIWADPQVKNAKDVARLMNESVPDVQKLVKTAGEGALLHGITVGDIVWDEHALFADYSLAVEKMGIPFFQCLGNHDMDYNKGGDEASDDTFQATYGPTYYSFNRGEVHYVVMDNVRYLGRDREYDGFFTQNQLDWLQKDLSFVPADRLLVLCVHIPVHSGTKNSEDLYRLLTGRQVHIMSGHTHYHRNVIRDNVFEHNHGTVCGAWWTGSICEDGTPNGYGVYSVKGTRLEWHYQATGESADHQMNIFVNEKDRGKELLVNIWNHDPTWKTEYWINGEARGALPQVEGFDPVAYQTMLGPKLPKPRGFPEPRKTNHLFRALVPGDVKEIRVLATDRFGKKYTQTKTYDN